MARYDFLSFMDAYLEYNQMRMYQSDQEKATFIIECGLYYYTVIPFKLKNIEATY